MAGAGYRTFQSGEVLTSTNVQTYLMDQAVQVYSGTAARSSAVPSPSTGMVAYSTATGLQVFNGSAWVAAGGGYGVATGGASTAITVDGINYTLLTFNSDANLVVSKEGLFDVLLVGGGAGSGINNGDGTGGGGAGQLVGLPATGLATIYLAAATYAVDVGAGGAINSSGLGSNIGNFISAAGGGHGGTNDQAGGGGAAVRRGQNGGSGGGGALASAVGGSAVGSFGGNAGGTAGSGTNGGGGGGGSSAVGANGVVNTSGAGGAGNDITGFTGSSATKCVGGAGTGSGGGGGAGAANTGNGGANNTGGSGIVLVRFKV